MKKAWFVILSGILFHLCKAQAVDLRELTGLLNLSQNKLQNHLEKKGFKKSFLFEGDGFTASFIRKDEEQRNNITRFFQTTGPGKERELIYLTTSPEEYSDIIHEIKDAGFTYPSSLSDSSAVLYQRQDTRIEASKKMRDTTMYYIFRAMRKDLPRWKNITVAEDLLQLDGEEYLKEVFGKENVKTDRFFYTKTESNRCSVVFPNTDREVVFIWNDEINLKDISFILIGEDLRPKAKTNNVNMVLPNAWTSRQGIHCGMSLKEVQQLNKEPLRFYNWRTESAGHLAPDNKGSIDFGQLKIVFNCLNCSFLNLSHSEIVDSNSVLETNEKVYVSTIIVLPEKNK